MTIVHERISAVVSLTLVGLALYSALEFPRQAASLTLFNSPLGIESPRQWLTILLLAGLAISGTDSVIRAHPDLLSQRLSYVATFCMLPGLLVVLATQLLRLAPNALWWAGGLLATGLMLWLTIVIEFRHVALEATESPPPETAPLARSWQRLWQQLLGYGLVLAFGLLIYETRSRAAVSATGVMVVSLMVASTLLRQPPARITKTWLYAGIIGLSLGQITWVLNYWQISTLSAGLFLFLIFYFLLGLAQQQLLGQFSTKLLWEFGFIALLGLAVIFFIIG